MSLVVGAAPGDELQQLQHELQGMCNGIWDGPLVPGGPGGSGSCGTMPMPSPMATNGQAPGHFDFSGAHVTESSMNCGTMPALLQHGTPSHLDCSNFNASTSTHLDVSCDESRRLDAFFSCLCESLVATLRSEFMGHLSQERENLRRQHATEMKRLHENHKESLTRLVASLQPGETISLDREQSGPTKESECCSARACANIPSRHVGNQTPDPSRAPATPGRARSPTPELQTQVGAERSRSTLPARLAREMQGMLAQVPQAPQMPQSHMVSPPSPQVGGLHNHHSYIETSPPPAQRQVVHVPAASSARRNGSPPPTPNLSMPVVASGVGTPQTQRPVSRTTSPLTQKRFPVVNPGPVVQVTAPQLTTPHQPVARNSLNVYTPGSPAQGVLSFPGPVLTNGCRTNSPPPAQRNSPAMPQPGYPCQVPSRDSSYKGTRAVCAGPVAPVQIATREVSPDIGAHSVSTGPAAGLSFNAPPLTPGAPTDAWLNSGSGAPVINPSAAAGNSAPKGSQAPLATVFSDVPLPPNCPPAQERVMVGRRSSEPNESAAS